MEGRAKARVARAVVKMRIERRVTGNFMARKIGGREIRCGLRTAKDEITIRLCETHRS